MREVYEAFMHFFSRSRVWRYHDSQSFLRSRRRLVPLRSYLLSLSSFSSRPLLKEKRNSSFRPASQSLSEALFLTEPSLRALYSVEGDDKDRMHGLHPILRLQNRGKLWRHLASDVVPRESRVQGVPLFSSHEGSERTAVLDRAKPCERVA